MRVASLFCLLIGSVGVLGQRLTVPLTTYAKDDRFERFNLNLALFELNNDTLLTWDFEGLKTAEAVKIIKPDGYKAYAYGYLFFAGNTHGKNAGFITLLVGNPYHANPQLYADLNNNANFTDDGPPFKLPWRNDSLVATFCPQGTNRCTQVKFTRHVVEGKFEYKRLMNEYYQFTYPNRKFIGMEHSYREQHYQTKMGKLALDGDTMWVALYDANNNGIYNEHDTDKFVVAGLTDTLVYPFDDLYSSTLSAKQGVCFVDKNGKQVEFVSAKEDGSELVVMVNNQLSNHTQLKPGKRVPNVKMMTWKGEQFRLRKYRKKQVYLYFGSPQSTNFSRDTAALRLLAENYKTKVTVIGFIEVNKSYELHIFGQYSYLNWILANKDKYLNKKLGIRGIPSSIYMTKRRRLKSYNLTPDQVIQQLEKP